MRSEVEEQVNEIDKALFIIGLREDAMMEVSKEEFEVSLKKAESCMRLVIETLSRNDITMKELHTRNKKSFYQEPKENALSRDELGDIGSR